MKKVRQLHHPEFYRKRALEFYEQAKRYTKEKEYEKAMEMYEEASRFDPNNSEYLYCAGIANRLLDNIEGAYYYLKKAYELDSSNLEYKYDLAVILFRRKRYKKSLVLFEEIKKEKGYDRNVLFYLGRIHAEFRHIEESSLLFHEILKREEDYETHVELGLLYLTDHKYGLSEKHLKKAIQMNENEAYPYYLLSKTFLKEGRHKEAISILESLKLKCPEEEELVKRNIEVIHMLTDF